MKNLHTQSKVYIILSWEDSSIMVRALPVLFAAATATDLVSHTSFGLESDVSLCSPCFQIGGQGINAMLNYLLNVGVVGGCQELCAQVPEGGGKQTACNLVCGAVGIKTFIAAIDKADLDPIYLCEAVHACPAAPDDAYVELVDIAASPEAVIKGNDIKMAVELNVTNATGVGEFRLAVDGPGSATPLSQSFFLEKGVPEGEQMIAVTLSVKDGQDDQGMPKTFEAGVYNFTFHVCQGECGSSHPHSKDFGTRMGHFTVTEAIEV